MEVLCSHSSCSFLAARNYFDFQQNKEHITYRDGELLKQREKLMAIVWHRHPPVTRVFKLSLCLPLLTAFLCVAQVSLKRSPELEGMLVCI